MAKSPWDSSSPEQKNIFMERALQSVKSKATSIQNILQLAHQKLVQQGLFNGGKGADFGYFSRSNPGFTLIANTVFEDLPSIVTPPKPEVKTPPATTATAPATTAAAKSNTTTYLIAGLVAVIVIVGFLIYKTSKKK